MEKSRNATYDLKGAAALTDCSPGELQRAVEAGDLATAEGEHVEGLRISGTELERWYLSFEDADESPFSDASEQ